MEYKQIAQSLLEAELLRIQISPITDMFPDLTVENAYKVQLINIAKKIESGQKVIGMKIGLTSRAMQRMLGVNVPDYGHLMDDMLLLEGEICDRASLLQPKVEGELAFILNKSIRGPGITIADVYNSVSYVVPAIEVVDSRIVNWRIKLQDTVADNGSSARFILGGQMTSIKKIDMRHIGMVFEKNGVVVSTGAGAAVMGNPAAAVTWLINALAKYDIGLNEGDIILSGAVTAAETAESKDIFAVSFHGIGGVTLRFE